MNYEISLIKISWEEKCKCENLLWPESKSLFSEIFLGTDNIWIFKRSEFLRGSETLSSEFLTHCFVGTSECWIIKWPFYPSVLFFVETNVSVYKITEPTSRIFIKKSINTIQNSNLKKIKSNQTML